MSHRAAFLVEKGTPLVIRERPTPYPSDEQVLVRVKAVALEVVDHLQRDLGIYVPEIPTILGFDAAGIVEKIGRKVTKFNIGDRIAFEAVGTDLDRGAFQEYCLAIPDHAGKIPTGITFAQAAALPIPFATSFTAFFCKSGADIPPPFTGPTVTRGPSVVILSGASSLGQMGIQLARISGFEKIVVTASTVHGEYLKELGATHVLDRHTTTADDILAVVPDVKLVYDTMAKESTRLLAISILSKQGGTPLESHPFDPREIPSNITAKWVIGDFERNPSGEGGPAWAAAVKWLEEGTLRPNKTEIFEGIEKVDEALTLLSKGVSGKKVVVTFD